MASDTVDSPPLGRSSTKAAATEVTAEENVEAKVTTFYPEGALLPGMLRVFPHFPTGCFAHPAFPPFLKVLPARSRARRQDAKRRVKVENDTPPTVLVGLLSSPSLYDIPQTFPFQEALRTQWREKIEQRERGENGLGLQDTIQELRDEG